MNAMAGTSVQSIIESHGGIHLTAYIESTPDLGGIKLQLEESLATARELLSSALDDNQMREFLLPLYKLLHDDRTLRSLKDNFGIFRTADSFRIMTLSTEVEHLTVVAETFHVKPLLKWFQNQSHFVWLDFGKHHCKVYQGDDCSLRTVKVLRLGETYHGSEMHYSECILEPSVAEIKNLRWRGMSPIVFLTGHLMMCEGAAKLLRHSGVETRHFRHFDDSDFESSAVARIRGFLARRSRHRFNSAMKEFELSEVGNSKPMTVGQIAQMVARGSVQKLMIAADVQIFGKFDQRTGCLAVTPTQFDHEDDDVLDDMAQKVIAAGGEVFIADKKEIPGNRPALIITKDETTPFSQQQAMEALARRAS